LSGTADLYFI